MPLVTTTVPTMLSDADTAGVVISPGVDSAGNVAKVCMFQIADPRDPTKLIPPVPPMAPAPTAAAGTGVVTGGGTFLDTMTTPKSYTLPELIRALKLLGVIQP